VCLGTHGCTLLLLLLLLLLLVVVVVVVVVVVLTATELSLGGSSPYTSTDKTDKNKYT
jgi:preprotein translocase subunit SecG